MNLNEFIEKTISELPTEDEARQRVQNSPTKASHESSPETPSFCAKESK